MLQEASFDTQEGRFAPQEASSRPQEGFFSGTPRRTSRHSAQGNAHVTSLALQRYHPYIGE